jgi:hypothetical protein
VICVAIHKEETENRGQPEARVQVEYTGIQGLKSHLRSEKVSFQSLFKNIGEKPAFREVGFSATFCSRIPPLVAFVPPILSYGMAGCFFLESLMQKIVLYCRSNHTHILYTTLLSSNTYVHILHPPQHPLLPPASSS